MIEYLLEDKKYVLSYQDLREEYIRICEMTDEEFLKNLPAAAHIACVICYLKEIPTYLALCDIGIVHELIHLMHIPEGNTTSLKEIRDLFKQHLLLA